MENLPDDYFSVNKVDEGVYAVISDTNARISYPGGNSCIIDLGDKTLIFDTFAFLDAAIQLISTAKQLTDNSEFILANSHWHFDHMRGNQVVPHTYGLSISSEKTRELMLQHGQEDIQKNKKEWSAGLKNINNELQEEQDPDLVDHLTRRKHAMELLIPELDDIKITLPKITFDSKLTYHGSKRRVDLITYGGAHTQSDVILYLPELRLLHGGDLILNRWHPYLQDGNPLNWIDQLSQIEKLDINIIIPGHGDIGNFSLITQQKEYFEYIKLMAKKITQQQIENLEEDEINHPMEYLEWNGGKQGLVKNIRVYMKKSYQ